MVAVGLEQKPNSMQYIKKKSLIYTHTFTHTSEMYNLSIEEVFQHMCSDTVELQWTHFPQISLNLILCIIQR